MAGKFFLIIFFFLCACADSRIYDTRKPFEDSDVVCRFGGVQDMGMGEHSLYDFNLFKIFRGASIPKNFRIPRFEDDGYPSYCVEFEKDREKSVAIFCGYINCLRGTFLLEYNRANFAASRLCFITDSQEFRCFIWEAENAGAKIEKEMEFKLNLMDDGGLNDVGFPAKFTISLRLSDPLLKSKL